jgi:hypothetical protein
MLSSCFVFGPASANVMFFNSQKREDMMLLSLYSTPFPFLVNSERQQTINVALVKQLYMQFSIIIIISTQFVYSQRMTEAHSNKQEYRYFHRIATS